MQFYSTYRRTLSGYKPDAETFELRLPDGTEHDRHSYHPDDYAVYGATKPLPVGWYWRALTFDIHSDGYPHGPFDNEAMAVADARFKSRKQVTA